MFFFFLKSFQSTYLQSFLKKEKTTYDFAIIVVRRLKVTNIDEAFEYIKKQEVKLINGSPKYRPFKIDNITQDDFYFFDKKKEKDINAKIEICNVISNIKYFYFLDKYGIQWELEQGHTDIRD
jgi:methylmalonyl-CoA/ethylmalonyl-CoA epimerase